jgi:hypothetical protein
MVCLPTACMAAADKGGLSACPAGSSGMTQSLTSPCVSDCDHAMDECRAFACRPINPQRTPVPHRPATLHCTTPLSRMTGMPSVPHILPNMGTPTSIIVAAVLIAAAMLVVNHWQLQVIDKEVRIGPLRRNGGPPNARSLAVQSITRCSRA